MREDMTWPQEVISGLPHDAVVWWALGFRRASEVHAWSTAGFTALQADFVQSIVASRSALASGPQLAVSVWRDSGVAPWWVALSVAAGVEDPHSAAALYARRDALLVRSLALRARGRGLDPWRLGATHRVVGPVRRTAWRVLGRWLQVLEARRR